DVCSSDLDETVALPGNALGRGQHGLVQGLRTRLKLRPVGPVPGWVARNSASGTTASAGLTHSLPAGALPSRTASWWRRVIAVATGPGTSSLTLMPCASNSWASARTSADRPALDAA